MFSDFLSDFAGAVDSGVFFGTETAAGTVGAVHHPEDRDRYLCPPAETGTAGEPRFPG